MSEASQEEIAEAAASFAHGHSHTATPTRGRTSSSSARRSPPDRPVGPFSCGLFGTAPNGSHDADERNLKAGTISDKVVDKYVAGLPDLADQSEPFGTSQPALAQPAVVEAMDDEEDDENDADGDDENEADEPAVAPETNTPE